MEEITQKNTEGSTTIVIFGATGDLSKRKLLPALMDLFIRGLLPQEFSVVGFSRGEMSNEAYKDFVKEVLNKKEHKHKPEQVEQFLEHIYYTQGLFDDVKSYETLSKFLYDADTNNGQCSNKLFYLATPPSFYDIIFQNLADSGLSIACVGEKNDTPHDPAGWTRIAVEKPFGKDLKTAQALDAKLALLFKENQIFRIDHYLAKETLENIITFRFSNALFEPMWNKDHIEKVHIKLFEDIGVEGRGAFYESVGALRDVGQNHMLQMLAFIAIENPQILDADKIRKERTKTLSALRLFEGEDSATKGQYKGYKEEENVSSDSKVATYFKIKTSIDNDKWSGVPFYLESGKKLKERKTEITVYFKKSETCVCELDESHEKHQNILTFAIQPEEGIEICFWVKKPGFTMEIEPKHLSFSYEKTKGEIMPIDAYEKILLDCISGDQTLFTSSGEVEAAWKFITPILKQWEGKTPQIYEQGSEGLK